MNAYEITRSHLQIIANGVDNTSQAIAYLTSATLNAFFASEDEQDIFDANYNEIKALSEKARASAILCYCKEQGITDIPGRPSLIAHWAESAKIKRNETWSGACSRIVDTLTGASATRGKTQFRHIFLGWDGE